VSTPLMLIVAGPPGAGKSTFFAVSRTGVDSFNSDDYAAQLNAGSYLNIPPRMREAAGKQLQQFIDTHIEQRRSFTFENALRTGTAFEQIRRAKARGFRVLLDYVAAGTVEVHIQRVMNRAALGGHSASERKLRDIYQNSMKNLVVAFEESRRRHIDVLRILDNSDLFGSPRLVLEIRQGELRRLASRVPVWLESALARSEFSIDSLRRRLNQK
jgi:predicted ABC-type ATPase